MSATWICATCGVEHPSSPAAPAHCPICEDDRQYVGPDGQQWTTLDELRASHRNETGQEEAGAMRAWSEAFGNCPVWLHEHDRRWVMRPGDALTFWRGTTQPLFGGLQLVHCGGHFDGYQVLHWPQGCGGKGVLFAGDQPQVCLDRRWVTFMYSYPNWTPFDAGTVTAITRALEPLPFDRLYGAFGRHVLQDAKGTIARSRERYLAAIGAAAT